MAKLPAMDVTIALSLVAIVVSVVALIISSHYASRQLTQASAVKAIEIMEATRSYRHVLYDAREFKKRYPDDWIQDEKIMKAANEVSRAFDTLGILDVTKQIDKKFVDRFYAIPAAEIWQICKQFVEDERKTRGSHHLWEFQQFAKRVKWVKGNHPSYTNRRTWPPDPRHKYLFTVDFQNKDIK